MLAVERRHKILEALRINQTISVAELCQSLEASEATIRRDLTQLEAEGKLERTHGGALVNDTRLSVEDALAQKETLFRDEKHDIAVKAYETLIEGDSLVMDGGTTTLELAKLIGKSNLKLTIITNSTIVFKELVTNPNLDLYMIGGKVRPNTLAAVGPIALDQLNRFNVEKAFIGTNGIALDAGFTTSDLDEALIKTAMLERAKTRYILADHSKFHKVYLNTFAPLSKVDVVITDSKADINLIKSIVTNYDLEILQ
jgi:DeoR family transcriptional regulator, fructose operon transcriptional repressor